MSLDVTTARTIIKQAIKDETYEGVEPEDDATCIKEAGDLVDMAEQAWAQYTRSPEVERILTLANKAPQNGDEPQEAESEPQSEPEQPEAEQEPQNGDEESETAPQFDLGGIDPELTKIEPWEGYGEDRVKDITDGVNVAASEEEPDSLKSLLLHILAYESSHKNRARVVKHVTEALGAIGVEIAASDAADESESASSEVPPSGDQDEEIQGEAQADGEGSHADQDAEHDAGEPASETRSERSKPAAKDTPKDKSSGSDSRAATPFGEDKNPAYRALVEGVERELEAERTHTPKRPSEEVPDLPWRWADISNSDLHDFHMQYAAAAYYTQYIVTRHERIAMHCREAADELHRELLNRANKYDEKGKPRTVTIIEAEIEDDPNVKSWRRRQRKHEQMAASAKRELDAYHKQVEALSRLETMRHNAWERARR